MNEDLVSSFAVRLRDVLSTLEVASLVGSADSRVRGLAEQLQFACLAMPCDEALVALELGRLGRLEVPGVATSGSWRALDLSFLPSGTPFAYLLGGGSGFAAELAQPDPMLQALAAVLESEPRHGLFVPVRVGASPVGGAALLRHGAPFGDEALIMGERLGEVLSLTLESQRTERVLLQLFAAALPDLCAADAPTRFAEALASYIHSLRLSPGYRERLELAEAVGRVAGHGVAETRLAADVLDRVARYLAELTVGQEGSELLDDDFDSDALGPDGVMS